MMDEQLIRTLVRESIARQAPPSRPDSGGASAFALCAAADESAGQVHVNVPLAGHVSHARYLLPDSGGPCLIEPSVQCNHCGYCQSHGH
jgi:hypothetical protein